MMNYSHISYEDHFLVYQLSRKTL